MEPERTTTMGEGESLRRERNFQRVKAVLRMRAKERVWERRAWGLPKREVREGIVGMFLRVFDWCREVGLAVDGPFVCGSRM